MGCCGVATEDKKNNSNERYTQNQSHNMTRNVNNPNNQINSINVFPNPAKKTNEEMENKIARNNINPLLNTNDKSISININNNPQEISIQKSQQKKEKVKPLKNIQILDNVKEYLPDDVTRDEIEEMVMGAIGDNVVESTHFKKGINLTRGHVEALVDIIYMNLVGTNNGNKDYEKILGDVKLKIGFCDINKESVKNIMFKGQNPTEGEIEQVLEQFKSSINPKLFVIELLN
mgnify:CR=1 FL=1